MCVTLEEDNLNKSNEKHHDCPCMCIGFKMHLGCINKVLILDLGSQCKKEQIFFLATLTYSKQLT